MKGLKHIVKTNLQKLTMILVVLFLLLAMGLQVLSTQNQAIKNANAMFVQISQILHENTAELEAIQLEYQETCLLNAETIAYIIHHHPEILGNVEEFRDLASMLEVDEIHIFDDTGRIFTGTHPEYYDFTFDSGEQINFFKPMMTDKTLRLCQDITPNTAEGKLVQYSALWSADGQYIVQVGMYPDAVLESTKKNELSYIFSLLQGNPGVSLYAIDPHTGKVIGSTSAADNGKQMHDLGLEFSHIRQSQRGTHLNINGVHSYCVFESYEGMLIGYVIATDTLYDNIPLYTLVLALCLTVIAFFMALVIQRFTGKYIIESISSINHNLQAVTEGDLEMRMGPQQSLEFSDLSNYINNMIQSLLASTDKMSFVLDRTNLHIGVYEYNDNMKTVRLTERIPEIFQLSPDELSLLSSDHRKMRSFLNRLQKDPVANMDNTYRYLEKTEAYIKLEEITRGNDVLGIVMDVTEQVISLKQAEAERDIDQLTGLYNRRGMERQFSELFRRSETMNLGAMVVVDSDNMKYVNDTYGHLTGDNYLKKLAEYLRSLGSCKSIAARAGGDEFVILLYGYETQDAIQSDLNSIAGIQECAALDLDGSTSIPLRFSYGWVYTQGRRDYNTMFLEADAKMYQMKKEHRAER